MNFCLLNVKEKSMKNLVQQPQFRNLTGRSEGSIDTVVDVVHYSVDDAIFVLYPF